MRSFVLSILLLNTSIFAAQTITYNDGKVALIQRVGDPTNPTDLPDEYLRDDYLHRAHPTVATLNSYFDDAANEFQVPAPLLEAVAQYVTNWTQVGPSPIGGWGVMGLVQNDSVNTLTDAAALLGVDEQTIKDDARQNIRG